MANAPMWTCFNLSFLFFLNGPPTTEIYTLSLHDALPIWYRDGSSASQTHRSPRAVGRGQRRDPTRRQRRQLKQVRKADRKSTRLNSSHSSTSYAVFCLKKKKKNNKQRMNIRAYAAQGQPD